jgi:hypothetical protein
MNLHFSESEDEEEENVIKKRKTTSHLIPILAGTIMQQYINGALYGGVPLSNRPSMIIRERYCISVRNICNKLGDSYFKRDVMFFEVVFYTLLYAVAYRRDR